MSQFTLGNILLLENRAHPLCYPKGKFKFCLLFVRYSSQTISK